MCATFGCMRREENCILSEKEMEYGNAFGTCTCLEAGKVLWRGEFCGSGVHTLCVSLPVRWDHPGYCFADPLPLAGLGSSLVVLASLLHSGK